MARKINKMKNFINNLNNEMAANGDIWQIVSIRSSEEHKSKIVIDADKFVSILSLLCVDDSLRDVFNDEIECSNNLSLFESDEDMAEHFLDAYDSYISNLKKDRINRYQEDDYDLPF